MSLLTHLILISVSYLCIFVCTYVQFCRILLSELLHWFWSSSSSHFVTTVHSFKSYYLFLNWVIKNSPYAWSVILNVYCFYMLFPTFELIVFNCHIYLFHYWSIFYGFKRFSVILQRKCVLQDCKWLLFKLISLWLVFSVC